jgi:hypothetical protein
MNRKRLLLAGLAMAGLLSAAGLLATNFQIYEVTPGPPATYAMALWQGAAPTVTWNENYTSTPANVTENGSGVTTSVVLTNAFSTWSSAQSPSGQTATAITFSFGSASTSFPQGPTIDCQNVIGFADPTAGDFPSGVIAFASIGTVTNPNTSPVNFNCGSNTGTCSISPGVCIIDVDIMFNPGFTFATSGATGSQFDLQSVATHEIGHLMGLDHSNIAHAVMYPYGDTSSIGVHTSLWIDDIVGAGHLYPGPGTADGNGIEGMVTLGGTGVYGADVEAIDATTGDVITETLTDPDGNYHLRVYDGTYYVYVQSLAPNLNSGPTTISNFRGQAGYGPPSNPTNYTGLYY